MRASKNVFSVGDRVLWDGRDGGHVVAVVDTDMVAVEFDEGFRAIAWVHRLDREAVDIWEDEVTVPFWDGPTLVAEIA